MHQIGKAFYLLAAQAAEMDMIVSVMVFGAAFT
jgi:hypothetical protein